MKYEIGKQYNKDDAFKAAARLHQSKYRAYVLDVDFNDYGNRLVDGDAELLLNYYDVLGVRETLRERYKSYSKTRDADMLRSEHIPFNLFAPLNNDLNLAQVVIKKALHVDCKKIISIQVEYAPSPKENYLNDATSFDAYIEYINDNDEKSGIGIEVKYTEKAYLVGKTEHKNVFDPESNYWRITNSSTAFVEGVSSTDITDENRQVWRNHLLGLAMMNQNDLTEFTSVILYPEGNKHFAKVIPEYQELLRPTHKDQLRGCTYEDFIGSITGSSEFEKWKAYLAERYLVKQ